MYRYYYFNAFETNATFLHHASSHLYVTKHSI